MRCSSCMTVNPEGNRFCEQCGSQLRLSCSRCGHEAQLTARFCGNCGNSLNPGGADPVAESTPKWGELKQATVLFADIVGSTDLVAQMDPDEAMAMLRPAVLRMRHSVERFGGTVVRTLGDGVMAMFGVPNALEGHAMLACQAALHMQHAFKQAGDGLGIRVGLHSGQVAADPEDAEDGRGGGAHGVTIHLASRVIALAQPGEICITEACGAAAGPGCQTEDRGGHQLKGIPDSVRIFRLMSATSSGPHRPIAPETTFRGRNGELNRLISALEGALHDGGRAVGLGGDAGAGKSRLCQEFAQLCRRRDIPVYEVRAQLYGHALPLQPILELFRVYFFGLTGSEDAATARERIDARFAPVITSPTDPQLLHEFFGVAPAEAPALGLDPRARKARLLTLVRALMANEAHFERVILIEDLHWLDEASEEFVAALVDSIAGSRTLLILNYRSAYRAPWVSEPCFEQIDLAELSPADMDALVSELLSPLTESPDIRRLVCRRAGGNPFFAEELVRTLAESHVLTADAGLPAGGIDAVARALPATIEAVIAARLDRVGEPEKTLLQMCAIIGKEIPLAVLEHVASPLAKQIRIGLEGLCDAGLILPQSAKGGRRFAFRHPLIQEVAYRTQLKVRRDQVHASVAAAMELYYADQIDEFAALIGHHFEQAGNAMQAAIYNGRAADWVGANHAAQAIKHWRKVSSLLLTQPRNPEVDGLRATAAAKIALLGWREGLTLREVKPLIDEAVALSHEVDDRLVPWLLTIEGRLLVAGGGSADEYVQCVKKALLYIDVDRDPGRVSVANAFLAQACVWAGLLKEAFAANALALEHVTEVAPYDRAFIGFDVGSWLLGIRGRVLVRLGRYIEAQECLERLLLTEGASGESPVPGISRVGFVELAHCLGDANMAMMHATELSRVAEQNGTPYVRVFALGMSGLASSLVGDHDCACTYFEQALDLIHRSNAAAEYESDVLAKLAEAHLRAGRETEAQRIATESISLSRRRATRLAECRALIVRGAAAAAQGLHAQAEGDLNNAQDLIELTGATSFEPMLREARAGALSTRAG